MADEGRLPRAKKAGDDRCRDFGQDFGKAVHERHPVLWRVGGCLIGAPGEPGPLRWGGERTSIDRGRSTPPALARSNGRFPGSRIIASRHLPRTRLAGSQWDIRAGVTAEDWKSGVEG